MHLKCLLGLCLSPPPPTSVLVHSPPPSPPTAAGKRGHAARVPSKATGSAELPPAAAEVPASAPRNVSRWFHNGLPTVPQFYFPNENITLHRSGMGGMCSTSQPWEPYWEGAPTKPRACGSGTHKITIRRADADRVTVAVGVYSEALQGHPARKMIRASWANTLKGSPGLLVRFIVPEVQNAEAADLSSGDFIQVPRRKGVDRASRAEALLVWLECAISTFPQAHFFGWCEDASWYNTRRLVPLLLDGVAPALNNLDPGAEVPGAMKHNHTGQRSAEAYIGQFRSMSWIPALGDVPAWGPAKWRTYSFVSHCENCSYPGTAGPMAGPFVYAHKSAFFLTRGLARELPHSLAAQTITKVHSTGPPPAQLDSDVWSGYAVATLRSARQLAGGVMGVDGQIAASAPEAEHPLPIALVDLDEELTEFGWGLQMRPSLLLWYSLLPSALAAPRIAAVDRWATEKSCGDDAWRVNCHTASSAVNRGISCSGRPLIECKLSFTGLPKEPGCTSKIEKLMNEV